MSFLKGQELKTLASQNHHDLTCLSYFILVLSSGKYLARATSMYLPPSITKDAGILVYCGILDCYHTIYFKASKFRISLIDLSSSCKMVRQPHTKMEAGHNQDSSKMSEM